MTQTHSCTGIDFCWKYINHWNCKIDGVDFFPAQYKWIHWVIRRKITYSGQVSNLFTSKITLKDNCQTSFLSNQNYTYSVEILQQKYVDFAEYFPDFCEFSERQVHIWPDLNYNPQELTFFIFTVNLFSTRHYLIKQARKPTYPPNHCQGWGVELLA